MTLWPPCNQTSLALTKQVMYEREQLENSLENLVPLVKATLGHAHSLQEQAVQFSLYDDQLEGSKGFKVTVQVPTCRKTPTNNNTTWCKECDRTCHRDCGLSSDNEKARCCVMDNGYCVECPNKCHWTKHQNIPYWNSPWKSRRRPSMI